MLERRLVALALVMLAACSPPPHEPTANGGAPVPDELAKAAAKFGLTMLADGFSWKAIDPPITRFEWSGRTASGDREILYSFFLPKLGASEAKLLPQIVASAAANLSEGQPCRATDQPSDFVKILGVDRVVSACFVPSSSYGKEFHHAIMHGIVNDGALTIVAVLSNDPAAAAVPMPRSIGARGK